MFFCTILRLYSLVLRIRILMSWFPIARDGTMATVVGILYTLTDPVLVPLRRVLPPVRMGHMALDLSPIVAFFGLSMLTRLLGC